ncbi:putative tuberous sclerosis 1 [Diaporthe ampelina]|uniref:Putative tuberous sclerosis 1 n=1 Tax=Diaporthe ampelina TaxID=1214573 RepID=A0A0G2FWK8_9PEZI|nr:putative tuberous sclerosis 1 [Diaporthe ampelina]
MITSNKAIKTGLHQSLANDSVPSLALSHQDSMPDKTSSKLSAPAAPVTAPSSTESDGEIQRLYKKILLLSNDLSFERYMKQQHMIHIGELKRRQLKEAATEAETQNLIMINRNLRNRIDEAKRSELRAKKESENRRNIAKKWETDLSAKLKVLREEQKKWSSEGAGLKRELEAKTEECEKLTRMVCEYETTELNSKQNLQAINDHVEEIMRLKAEVSRLIEVEQTYQAKERETEERLAEAAVSIGRAEVLRSSFGTVLQRPSTPSGSGIQNTGRKDKRDKKSSGIRGIRGFV